jgi:hypothetical protein
MDLMDYPDSDEGAAGSGDRTEIEDSILDTEDMDVGSGAVVDAAAKGREITERGGGRAFLSQDSGSYYSARPTQNELTATLPLSRRSI